MAIDVEMWSEKRGGSVGVCARAAMLDVDMYGFTCVFWEISEYSDTPPWKIL